MFILVFFISASPIDWDQVAKTADIAIAQATAETDSHFNL
jgi:hypothetical protein